MYMQLYMYNYVHSHNTVQRVFFQQGKISTNPNLLCSVKIQSDLFFIYAAHGHMPVQSIKILTVKFSTLILVLLTNCTKFYPYRRLPAKRQYKSMYTCVYISTCTCTYERHLFTCVYMYVHCTYSWNTCTYSMYIIMYKIHLSYLLMYVYIYVHVYTCNFAVNNSNCKYVRTCTCMFIHTIVQVQVHDMYMYLCVCVYV